MKKSTHFTQLYEENRDRIYRLCCAYCADPDQRLDLLQSVFLAAWRHLDQFEGRSAGSTWLYRIAVNTALMWVRQEKRREQLFDPLGTGPAEPVTVPDIAEQIERDEQLSQLLDAISELPELDRLVIGMALEGLPYKDISEVTGMTVNHVGVKINRIKKALQEKLEV